MDKKSASASKAGKYAPRHAEKNERGTEKNPFNKTATKAELLARMKASAAARKTAK